MAPKINVIVPIKRVIDYQLVPRVNPDKTLKITNFAINPFDDIAIEESLKLKEAKFINKIKVLTITNNYKNETKALKDLMIQSMAKGVDETKIISVTNSPNTPLIPLTIAKLIQKEVKEADYNLVICGKQAIDDDSGNVGQMLAGLLNWKQANNCCKVEPLGEDQLKLTKEIDNGEEIVEGALPMVLTTDLRLNTPRYATLPKIMKAKKKPIAVEEVEIDTALNSQLRISEYMEPPAKKQGKIFTTVEDLINQMKQDKVI
ncbi:hypothetical protein ACO0SA_003309 [Hanseniaspora valbyensis]